MPNEKTDRLNILSPNLSLAINDTVYSILRTVYHDKADIPSEALRAVAMIMVAHVHRFTVMGEAENAEDGKVCDELVRTIMHMLVDEVSEAVEQHKMETLQ